MIKLSKQARFLHDNKPEPGPGGAVRGQRMVASRTRTRRGLGCDRTREWRARSWPGECQPRQIEELLKEVRELIRLLKAEHGAKKTTEKQGSIQ